MAKAMLLVSLLVPFAKKTNRRKQVLFLGSTCHINGVPPRYLQLSRQKIALGHPIIIKQRPRTFRQELITGGTDCTGFGHVHGKRSNICTSRGSSTRC